MRIFNQTGFSTKLIKSIMKEAGVKADKGSTLTVLIKDDFECERKIGEMALTKEDGKKHYVVSIKSEGDTATLAHELRHVQQGQYFQLKAWYDAAFVEWAEEDADMFEARWA